MPQYFPTGYNPTYGYGTQYPFPTQTYPSYNYTQNPVGQTVQNVQPTQQMTPPTIRAEIIQVEDRQAVENYPVAAGITQMFMSKDDKFIFIKTAFPNAPYELVVYEKQAKVESKPVSTVDTDKFVTRDELEQRLSEIVNRKQNYKKNYDKQITREEKSDG